MNSPYCMILTATSTQEEAEKLASLLVAEKQAACVQITSINSVYRWQGEVQHANEFLLIIKTTAVLYSVVEATLLKHHSYETPEIIQVPAENGSKDYLRWIDSQTQR
jgi:periplasmic divalent cation tolerance protein